MTSHNRTSDRDALGEAPADVGIRAVGLDTPFPVGPVNSYLFCEDRVTVVDTGLGLGDSSARLESALEAGGTAVAEVDQVVITHAHPDHFGGAAELATRSDATVLASEGELQKLRGEFDPDLGRTLMASLGVPDDIINSARLFFEATSAWIKPLGDHGIRCVTDGERIVCGDREITVLISSGHSRGHVALWDQCNRVLISGDHLLPEITPNPTLEPDPFSELFRRRSLEEYLASLDRYVELDPAVVLPGHGPAFHDLAGLVERTRRHHILRAETILGHLEDLGEGTAYELSRVAFPDVDGMESILSVSEVAGHLDLLVGDGRVDVDLEIPFRYGVSR